MKTIDVKVTESHGNKVKLLKRKENGAWHDDGKTVSLKALFDGRNSNKYNVVEWTDCARQMYNKYKSKKPTEKIFKDFAYGVLFKEK